MSWTDERVELLKKLWMEGLSASQIANELGDGVTRNAVIGKVHRLKLSARAKPTNSAPRPRATQRPAAPRRVTSPGVSPGMSSAVTGAIKRTVMRTQTMGATALAVSEEIEMEAYVAPQGEAEIFIPEAQRVSLLQLNEHTCKWPIGDPLSAGFHFCGGQSLEGKPYCEFHSHKAYHQIERKKR